jgi:hypothetical protein
MNALLKFTLSTIVALLLAAPAIAAEDEFGSNFTSTTPAGLQDPGVNMDFAADTINKIEPAAGESIWLDPEDMTGEAAAVPGTDILVNPNAPAVPGMEPAENAAPALPPVTADQ